MSVHFPTEAPVKEGKGEMLYSQWYDYSCMPCLRRDVKDDTRAKPPPSLLPSFLSREGISYTFGLTGRRRLGEVGT